MRERLACIYCGRTVRRTAHHCRHCDKVVVKMWAGRFEQRRVLKASGNGFSIFGWDHSAHREVLLRVLTKDAGKAAQEELVREAHILRAGDASPNFPTILVAERLRETGALFTAQQWVEGTPIHEILRKAPPREYMGIAERVLEPLCILHAAECVHGAIGPNAFLMTDSGLVVLTDLRAARRIGEPGGGTGVVGFRAPEQSGRGAALVPATDIFAFAAVFYHAITGRYPYGKKENFSRVPRSPSQLNHTLTADYDELLLKALSPDASARYAAGLDLLRDLHGRSGPVTVIDLTAPKAPWLAEGLQRLVHQGRFAVEHGLRTLVSPLTAMNDLLHGLPSLTRLPRTAVAGVTAASCIGLGAWIVSATTELNPPDAGTDTAAEEPGEVVKQRETPQPPPAPEPEPRQSFQADGISVFIPQNSKEEIGGEGAKVAAFVDEVPQLEPLGPIPQPAASQTSKAERQTVPAKPAYVRFLSWPVAQVYVDGYLLTEAPNRDWIPISSGTRVFTFVGPNGKRAQRQTILVPESPYTLRVNLESGEE